MEITMMNDAFKHQGGYQGLYERSKILVNGKPSWNDSFNAIWYIPKRYEWVVGNLSDLGHNDTDMNNKGLKIWGQFMYDSGLGMAKEWKYWNGSKWNSPNYPHDLHISCKGMY